MLKEQLLHYEIQIIEQKINGKLKLSTSTHSPQSKSTVHMNYEIWSYISSLKQCVFFSFDKVFVFISIKEGIYQQSKEMHFLINLLQSKVLDTCDRCSSIKA